jgi:hypothetical protein
MTQFSPYGPMPVEIYATSPSVIAGGSIGFCVSVTQPTTSVTLQIFRSGQFTFSDSQFHTQADSLYARDYRPLISLRDGQQPLFQITVQAVTQPIPDQASSQGCGWIESARWQVPPDQISSVYLVRASQATETSYALFVVRAQTPGAASKILCQLSLNTYQAYNPWGGYCLYGDPISKGDVGVVSFERPCQLWDYILYDEPIVTWLESNFSVEFCTNPDVHADPSLLSPYQLMVSCGHDEYWSKAMRDQVESFADAGGNVLIFSGNTMYRPVSFDAARMTRTAGSWGELERPEALTTGVNWSAGLWNQELPKHGYDVAMSDHWIFDGTALAAGGTFGYQSGIIGYEADAGVYDETGQPVNPSPKNLLTLATADLEAWVNTGNRRAGLTAYRRQQGCVLSASTTGWGQGLRNGDDPAVERITLNMLRRFRLRFGIIYTIDNGNLRWYRDWSQDTGGGTCDIGKGSTIGTGAWEQFTAVFGDETGNIYAATSGGDILRYRDDQRDGSGDIRNAVLASSNMYSGLKSLFAGGDGILYAVTYDGNLHWYRDLFQSGGDSITGGQVIGHGGWADFKFVFNGGGGIIYAVNEDGSLYWYCDRARNGTGDVGTGAQIATSGWHMCQKAFADSTGCLYAVDTSGMLTVYKDRNRNGTGQLTPGEVIGFGGWDVLTTAFSGS